MSWFAKFWRSPSLEQFNNPIPRERLIQSARIAVIDDEVPLLIDELRKVGFAVDHDRSANDLRKYDGQIYDLAVIDYHGVGRSLGSAQGLDLVRHLRRVSPRTRLVAYTSRSLSSAESEFYRLCHAVLGKDEGLGESLVLIEGELQKALSKQHLLDALLEKLAISDEESKQKAAAALSKALQSRDQNRFKEHLKKAVGYAAEKGVDLIIGKLFLL